MFDTGHPPAPPSKGESDSLLRGSVEDEPQFGVPNHFHAPWCRPRIYREFSGDPMDKSPALLTDIPIENESGYQRLAMTNTAVTRPPKVRLAIRVGVTGHRPNRLGNADDSVLRERIRQVLQTVRDVGQQIAADGQAGYASGAPIFRVVSPLAEGADKMVAEEAIAIGYELQCPLPFSYTDYEHDFATPESRQQFRGLLARATAVLELDGSRESEQSENRSYEAVGRTVLRQSDILIAVWDGTRLEGQGGTAQIVGEAVQLRIPTIWIRTEPPHAACLLACAEVGGHCELHFDEFPKQLMGLLRFEPEKEHASPEGPRVDLRDDYFLEKPRTWILGVLFGVFSKVVAGSWRWPPILLKDYQRGTREEWQGAWAVSPDLPSAAKHQVEAGFLLHYTWADKLANYYANLYRSSFVLNYLLAACAVLFALRAYFDASRQEFWILAELATIILIIAVTTLGRRRRWHERWIDYRLLAEKLRQMRFLFLIGRSGKTDPVPEHESQGDPRKTWVNWHFQAVVREVGMLREKFDPLYRLAYRKLLVEHELPSQVEYHGETSRQFKLIYKRLHTLGTSLFFGTLVVCLVHFMLDFDFSAPGDRQGTFHRILVQLAAIFPAFGAALHGIVSQGDFHQVARRSAAMHHWLSGIVAQVKVGQEAPSAEVLGELAEKAAEVMGAELIDWHVAFQDKPLVFPS